ncbi:MAG: NAD(P)-binding domain-containing protein [Methylobacteriaceae bacterium]|nr:NAD(P)-binding domain-containing protein [Methylobacteriaceae bacterium]
MQVAVLGAGQVGRAVGLGWRKAGHAVVFGVPDPSDAKHADLGTGMVRAVPDAVRDAEVIALATPWAATEAALRAAGDLRGRIVIDCTNPLAFAPGQGLHLSLGFETSGAERVAGWAAGARVYKALNQTGAEGMAEAAAFPQRPVMFVAGDDPEGKQVVVRLVADLGFEALDGGPLVNARLLEPLAMVWIDQALKRGQGRDFALAITRKPAGKDVP